MCIYPADPPSIEYVHWLAVLPEGIRNVAILLVLSDQTLQVVDEIAKRERFQNPGNILEAQLLQSVGWIEDLKDACPALNLPDDPNGTPLDKLLCLALLQYCTNKFDISRALLNKALWDIKASLLDQLPRVHVPANTRFRHCLIWIWLVAFQAVTDDLEPRGVSAEGGPLLHLLPSKFLQTRRWTVIAFISLGESSSGHRSSRE